MKYLLVIALVALLLVLVLQRLRPYLRIAQEFVNLVGIGHPEAELLQREIDPAALKMVRVEINDGQDDILSIGSLLGVRDQFLIVGRMKTERIIRAQAGVQPIVS